MSNHSKKRHVERQSLIHVTPVNCADSIIESQHFNPGNGLYGIGVYFANTLEAAFLKVKHHRDPNIKWTYLIADVYIGKAKKYKKQEAISSTPINTQELVNQGYSTIFGYQQPTGREVVCLDPTRIHNIKYIDGEKPSKFFFINRTRIVLFYVTDVSQAATVHDTQIIPKTDGPFGTGYYLYYTLADAKSLNRKANTFFACDANLYNFHELTEGETLGSSNIRRSHFRSFHACQNNIQYYIFTDKKLLKNFHFCGGKPWNSK